MSVDENVDAAYIRDDCLGRPRGIAGTHAQMTYHNDIVCTLFGSRIDRVLNFAVKVAFITVQTEIVNIFAIFVHKILG